jgi:hypothetical protein
MAKRNNCMYALPHELTGLGECCGLFQGQLSCNGYGAKCAGYMPHNAESRKALAEAIAERRKQKQKKETTDADHT